MRKNKHQEDNTGFWFVLFALIIAIVIYIYSKFKVEDENKKLTNHLFERKEALNDIFYRIEYYRKLKVELVVIKKRTTVFLRFFISILLLVANGLYINQCYPDSITLQHVFEGVATFNAAVLFLTSIIVFAIKGSFLEIKSTYHSIQTLTLERLFRKSEETIESVLRLDLENRESIRAEITETENAIKQNDALLTPQPMNFDTN